MPCGQGSIQARVRAAPRLDRFDSAMGECDSLMRRGFGESHAGDRLRHSQVQPSPWLRDGSMMSKNRASDEV